MLVLALDTSSLALSCALLDGNRVLAESLHFPPERHGDLLPGALLALCERAGVKLSDITALAAGVGPGSFTGLRVGLAAAKSIAYARRIPLAGASSLQALARAQAGVSGRTVIATLEARKAELYALIEGREAAWRAPQLVQYINERSFINPPLLVGPGAAACAAELPAEWLGPAEPPLAREVAALCLPALQGARYDQPAVFALQPNYLKPSEAEVALAEGRVGKLPHS